MKIFRNQYKREDVFFCSHSSHRDFNKRASVYHVLVNKRCYPYGCVNFKESCKQKNSCPKGFRRPNEKCGNYKFLIEEKIVQIPQISEKINYEVFQEELNEFSDWIEKKNGRFIQFWSTTNSVKPLFAKTVYAHNEKIHHKGFIINFKDGYIDKDFLDDYSYLLLNINEYKRLKPTVGDEIEFRSKFSLQKGRIVFKHPSQVDFINKNTADLWSEASISMAIGVGKSYKIQLEKCFQCDKGILIEVLNKETNNNYRQIYCTEGIASPYECYYFAELKEKSLDEEI